MRETEGERDGGGEKERQSGKGKEGKKERDRERERERVITKFPLKLSTKFPSYMYVSKQELLVLLCEK